MDMQRPKVPTELLLRFNANVFKILAAEDYNTPLSNQQGEFIFL